MKNYIAIVKNEGNKVTKYQDFASKSECDAHVEKYGGFVVDKPSDDRTNYWIVDSDKKTVIYDKSTADSDAAKDAATQYQKDRAVLYPRHAEQFDALWKGGDAQAAMKVIIDKIKSDNPKP